MSVRFRQKKNTEGFLEGNFFDFSLEIWKVSVEEKSVGRIEFVFTLTHLCRPVRSTFAVRETASLGIMGAPRVPPLNPSESIVLSLLYLHSGLFSIML